jgi:hypothetical protein
MKNRLFDIGKMRHRVTLYTVTRVDDGAGGFERQDPSVPTELGTFWRVLTQSVRRNVSGESNSPSSPHTSAGSATTPPCCPG